MAKAKKNTIDFNAPATRSDVEDLALLTDKHFRKANKRMDRLEQNMVTKEDLKQFATKEDLENSEDSIAEKVANRIQAAWEKREADLEEIHQDQLDIVAGKKAAPRQWRTVPRRLMTAEMDIRKIKDHLRIS